MAVQFQNYEYSYMRGNKPVFAPSALGERIGQDIKAQVEFAYAFDDFVYHLRKKGGHIAALHTHRDHNFFARIDIANFFYSIGRNRVQRALTDVGILRARHYAKWSCVKNPFGDPSYALPYGFVQSPILATLVLMQSNVGHYLRKLSNTNFVKPSVYVDDISLSSDDENAIRIAFDDIVRLLEEAKFTLNQAKLREPCGKIDVFNCDLAHGKAAVQQARLDTFYAEPRSQAATFGFDDYCARVELGNAP